MEQNWIFLKVDFRKNSETFFYPSSLMRCQGEKFTFAPEILDQLIDALSDENESES